MTYSATMGEALRVFLSYRRDDQQFGATMLRWGLEHTMPGLKVVKDVIDIPFGSDFVAHIRDELVQCDALLVLIGRNWAPSRLHDAEDMVRLEIEQALESQLEILPVLVESACMPGPEALPSSIKELALRNAAALRPDPDFEMDLRRLVERGLSPIAQRKLDEEARLQAQAKAKIAAERRAKRAQRLLNGEAAVYPVRAAAVPTPLQDSSLRVLETGDLPIPTAPPAPPLNDVSSRASETSSRSSVKAIVYRFHGLYIDFRLMIRDLDSRRSVLDVLRDGRHREEILVVALIFIVAIVLVCLPFVMLPSAAQTR